MKEFKIEYLPRITGGYEYKITIENEKKDISSIRIPERKIKTRDDAYNFIKKHFGIKKENVILRVI